MRRFDLLDVPMFFFMCLVCSVPFVIVMLSTDKVNVEITNNYLPEYMQCQEDLERTQPICPACECKSSSGLMQGILGFIWGMICMFLMIQYKDDIKKKFSKNKNGGKE